MANLLPPSTTEKAHEKVHDSEICPISYEDVAKEAVSLLNPGYFKGLYLNYTGSTAFLGEKLDISSTVGLKHYEFDASYFSSSKLVFFSGNVTTQGEVTATMGVPMGNRLCMQSAFVRSDSRLYNALLHFDFVAPNYRAQVQLLGIDVIRATYIQRVTPHLYLGGYLLSSGRHFFWPSSVPQKLEVGYAARYETDKMVASAKVDSNGDVLMTYLHKISKKVSLATDFMYNCFSRDVKASVGYECNSRLSLVRGKIDSNGVVSGHLQRNLNVGIKCLLSASLDLKNNDRKLGLRLTYG